MTVSKLWCIQPIGSYWLYYKLNRSILVYFVDPTTTQVSNRLIPMKMSPAAVEWTPPHSHNSMNSNRLTIGRSRFGYFVTSIGHCTFADILRMWSLLSCMSMCNCPSSFPKIHCALSNWLRWAQEPIGSLVLATMRAPYQSHHWPALLFLFEIFRLCSLWRWQYWNAVVHSFVQSLLAAHFKGKVYVYTIYMHVYVRVFEKTEWFTATFYKCNPHQNKMKTNNKGKASQKSICNKFDIAWRAFQMLILSLYHFSSFVLLLAGEPNGHVLVLITCTCCVPGGGI